MKLVTVGIPVYKRLQYLPRVLEVVTSQDYPNIELIVSDNGMNGGAVQEILKRHYPTARFRQNAETVDIITHFNQIIHQASGDYYVPLQDDDEISSNYVSELVKLLERYPQASFAMGVQETIDEAGVFLRKSSESVPELLSGTDFVRAVWETHEYKFEALSTFLVRTQDLRAAGGFPDFWKGTSSDDALIVRLCLDRFVALSPRCAYRKRFFGASYGYAMTAADLARGIKDFLKFLDRDPVIIQFARRQPSAWAGIKRVLVDKSWKTYYYRWIDIYRGRLSTLQWVRAGFSLPLIPEYYKAVTHTWLSASKAVAGRAIRERLGRRAPAVKEQ